MITDIRIRMAKIIEVITLLDNTPANITALRHNIEVVQKFPSVLIQPSSITPAPNNQVQMRSFTGTFNLTLFNGELGSNTVASNKYSIDQLIDAIMIGFLKRSHLELSGDDGIASAPLEITMTNTSNPIRFPRGSQQQYYGAEFTITVPFIINIERLY